MFLSPEVGGKIEALGINVRENFTITRKWDEQNDSPATWEVARLVRAGEKWRHFSRCWPAPAAPAALA